MHSLYLDVAFNIIVVKRNKDSSAKSPCTDNRKVACKDHLLAVGTTIKILDGGTGLQFSTWRSESRSMTRSLSSLKHSILISKRLHW